VKKLLLVSLLLSLVSSNITNSGAVLLDRNGTFNNWEVVYGPAGFTLGVGGDYC